MTVGKYWNELKLKEELKAKRTITITSGLQLNTNKNGTMYLEGYKFSYTEENELYILSKEQQKKISLEGRDWNSTPETEKAEIFEELLNGDFLGIPQSIEKFDTWEAFWPKVQNLELFDKEAYFKKLEKYIEKDAEIRKEEVDSNEK